MKSSEKVKVALVRCSSYELAKVSRALEEGIELAGGFDAIFRRGEKVLLKPNLLAPDPPETATTTHPAVFEAVSTYFLERSCIVSYGDSPCFHDSLRAFKKSGMHDVAVRLNLRAADFTNKEKVFFEHGRQNKFFEIAKGALEADCIVSLPKLKTHGLTLLTGAIKNQLGCVPGMAKSAFHAKLETVEKFSQMLVDLTMFLKPRLYIMDGITAMEGNGPRRGKAVNLGVLLVSTDPVALDAAAASIIGLEPGLVIPIVIGSESGLGTKEDFEVVGDRIENVRKKFALPRFSGSYNSIPPFIRNAVKSLLIYKPVINYKLCSGCLECRRICPTNPKSILIRADRFPEHNYRTCINCYCCQETCPEGAITLKIKPLKGGFA